MLTGSHLKSEAILGEVAEFLDGGEAERETLTGRGRNDSRRGVSSKRMSVL